MGQTQSSQSAALFHFLQSQNSDAALQRHSHAKARHATPSDPSAGLKGVKSHVKTMTSQPIQGERFMHTTFGHKPTLVPQRTLRLAAHWCAPFIATAMCSLAAPNQAAADERPSPEVLAAIEADMPQVTLDKLFYHDGDELLTTVRLNNPAVKPTDMVLILSAPQSGDVELLPLTPSQGDLLVAEPISFERRREGVEPGDGVFCAHPGEVFVAMVTYQPHEEARLAVDFGVAFDDSARLNARLSPELRDFIAANAGEHDRELSFIMDADAQAPVQFATHEVLFKPKSAAQLSEFLDRYQGQLLDSEGSSDMPQEQWHRVRVQPNAQPREHLAQMRQLVGDVHGLYFDSDQSIEFFATAMEMWLEGYHVAVNPKVTSFQAVDAVDTPFAILMRANTKASAEDKEDVVVPARLRLSRQTTDGRTVYYETRQDTTIHAEHDNTIARIYPLTPNPNGDFNDAHMTLVGTANIELPGDLGGAQFVSSTMNYGDNYNLSWESSLREEVFGVPSMWRFMAQIDADEREIPVAFIDQGFAIDPDYRGYPDVFEVDVDSGARGRGAAEGLPTVGASLFGSKVWHGSQMVHTAGGVLNNGYGTRGVAGQVLVPRLYRMTLGTYAFDSGRAIQMAVDDGAAIINASFGFPCRLLWTLGPDRVCNEAGRAWFTTKLIGVVTAAVKAATAVLCAGISTVPGVGALLCAAIVTQAINLKKAAVLAEIAALIVPYDKGPVERAVQYAVERGVPVVASAGNRLSFPLVLRPLVNNAPEDATVENWDIIPASIPGVIAVGAAAGAGFHNNQFFGDRVDVWAPEYARIWEPTDITQAALDAGHHHYIEGQADGTSAAAAYISGVLANIMAVAPDLDPRHNDAQGKRTLVERLRHILTSTAHQSGAAVIPTSAQAADLYEDFDQETLDQFDRRRNLVHPWRAVRDAAHQASLWDYDNHGYNVDAYGRFDPQSDAGTTIAIGQRVVGTIGHISAGSWSHGAGLTVMDSDAFTFSYPSTPALYRARVEITTPRDQGRRPVWASRLPGRDAGSTAYENTYEMYTDWKVHDSPVEFHVDGGYWAWPDSTTEDSPYKLKVDIGDVRPLPPPDRFEGTGPIPVRGVPCDPEDRGDEWTPVYTRGRHFSRTEVEAFEREFADMSIHSPSDEDIFHVQMDECADIDCERCPPRLWVYMMPYRPWLNITVYDQHGQKVGEGDGRTYIDVDCQAYQNGSPLTIKVSTEEPIAQDYNLRLRWSVLDEAYCCEPDAIEEHHGGIVPDWCHMETILPVDPRLDMVNLDGFFRGPAFDRSFDDALDPHGQATPSPFAVGIPVEACMGLVKERSDFKKGATRHTCLPFGVQEGESDAAFDDFSVTTQDLSSGILDPYGDGESTPIDDLLFP